MRTTDADWLCSHLVVSAFVHPITSFCFRSNVLGTKFTVFDGGENPEKKPFIKESESVRQELAAICYVSPNVLATRNFPLHISRSQTCNTLGYRVAGEECSRFERSQEDDGDHTRHVRERRKGVHSSQKRTFTKSALPLVKPVTMQ